MTLRSTSRPLLVLGALLLAGCGGHKGSKSHLPPPASTAAPVSTTTIGTPGGTATTGGSTTPGLAPAVILTQPASPATAPVRLEYTLIDADSDPATVLVAFSIDDGASWAAASDAGAAHGSDGTSGLASSPTGEARTFMWDAAADVGHHLRAFVRLRLTPSDPDGVGNTEETATFTLDATAAATRLSTLVIPLDVAGPSTVNVYDVDALGGLGLQPGSPIATGGDGRQMSSASGLAASPRGDRVFASHNASASIEVFDVDATGALARVAGSPFPTAAHPTQLAIHPSGRTLYTTNGDALEAFDVDPTTGALTPLAGSPFSVGTSPRALAVHPRGDLLYTGHMFGADAGVRVHALDPASGAPSFSSAISLSSFNGRPGKELALTPDGARLICTDLDQGVFVMDVDATTGELSLVVGAPHSFGAFLGGGLALTHQGEHLYVTVDAQGLHGFRIEASGALTPVPGSPFPNVGNTSLYLQVDAADERLFVSSRGQNSLRVYEIDAISGTLSEVAGSPFLSQDPAGIVGPVLSAP